MTDPAAPAQPTGLKAKVSDLGLKAYLKAPPPAQTAMLNGFVKAQPVIAKVKPHAKKALALSPAILVVRKLRQRGQA